MTTQAERICGVVYLGASRFPYKEGLDKPSFAAAKQAAGAVLTAEYLIASEVKSLDLFDQELNQEQITDRVADFLKAPPKLTDLIIYYCGHGGFLPHKSFYLTLRSTKDNREAGTGFSLRRFRLDLENLLFDKRIYLVLDCCYAAAAVDAWQSDKGAKEVIVNDIEMAFPPRGTALIAAASRTSPALAPEERETTLFTGHFVEAVRAGIKDRREVLSFADLAENIEKRIRTESLRTKVLPELHVPRQLDGDLSRMPFIKNPSFLPIEPGKNLTEPFSLLGPYYSQDFKVTFTPARGGFDIGSLGIAAEAPKVISAIESAAAGARPKESKKARAGRRRKPAKAVAAAASVKSASELAAAAEQGSTPDPAPQTETASQMAEASAVRTGADGISDGQPLQDSGGVQTSAIERLFKLAPQGLSPRKVTTVAAAAGVGLALLLAYTFYPTNSSVVSIPPPGRADIPVPPAPHKPPELTLRSKKIVPPSAPAAYCGSPPPHEIRIVSAGGPFIPANVKINPIMTGAHALRAVALAPDQSMIATAGDDGQIQIWNTSLFKLHRILRDKMGKIYSLDFAIDHGRLLLASASLDGKIRIWNPLDGRLLYGFSSQDPQYALAFYPHVNPHFIYSGGRDGLVRIWDLQRHVLDKEISNKVSAQEERGVRTLSIAPSGHRQFVAGNWDGTINFVSAGGKSKTVKAFARLVLRIAYSPNGKFVLSGGSNLHGKNLKLWDAQSEDYIRSFDGHTGYVVSVAWSPDGKTIASGGGRNDEKNDRSIRLWNAASGSQLHKYSGHSGDIEAVTFAADGSRLVSVSEDMTLRVWDVATEKKLMTVVPYDDGSYLAFTPDGCYSGTDGVGRHFKVSVDNREEELSAQLKNALFNPKGFSFLAAK